MAKTRTYKRDAKGRFAGGGAKDPRGPAKVGRAGPRGGKTGTRTQQKKAKQAQQSRTQQFQSKTQASSARDAYKAASRGARMSEKGAAKKVVGAAKKTGIVETPVVKKKIQLPRSSKRLPNRTGSSKQLTRYNSTQSGSGRRPLDVMKWERDLAKARLATKTDRARSRSKQKQARQVVTDRRANRAAANQRRVTAGLKRADGSGFRRGTRRERRSIFTAQAALSFYRSNSAVDTQRVDVRRPGFRLPRSARL